MGVCIKNVGKGSAIIIMDLTSFRNEIDRIDEQLLSLFEDRMEIVRKIAQYKKEARPSGFSPGGARKRF